MNKTWAHVVFISNAQYRLRLLHSYSEGLNTFFDKIAAAISNIIRQVSTPDCNISTC